MPTDVWNRWLQRMRPRTALGYWSAAAFLIAVIRLLLVRGLDLNILILLLFPPLLAIVFQRSDRKSTQALAASFLTLIDFGVAIGRVRWMFPELRPIDAALSRADNRVLGWYVLVYLLYVFVILPPVIFGRGLRRRRKPGDFSTFTNVLGLAAWALIGPLMCWSCASWFGLWPPVRW